MPHMRQPLSQTPLRSNTNMRSRKHQRGFLDGILSTIAGPAISGVLGFLGQEDTNDQNLQIAQNATAFNAAQAHENREFTAQQAEKQMNFQERMSNSAWQRGVADMQAAGINPMLAFNKGGASTPTGAMGGGSPASAVTIPMQNAMAAGMQSAGQIAMLDNTQAATERTKAETRRTDADTVRVAADTGRIEALRDNIRQEMQSFEKRMERLGYETSSAKSQATHDMATKEAQATHRYNYASDIAKADRDKIVAEADRLRNMANLLGLEVPKAINEAAHHIKYQNYHIEWGPFVDDAGKMINSAANAFRSLRRAR